MEENTSEDDEARERFEESLGISIDNLLEEARADREHQELMRAEGKLPDGTDRDHPEQIVFGDLVWGSCQYDTAADTYYNLLRNAPESLRDVAYVGRVRPIEHIISRAQNYVQEWKQDLLFEYEGHDQEEWASNWVRRTEKEVNNLSTIEDCFALLRNKACDLWHAAPRVCDWVFTHCKLNEIADRTDGVGPVMNMISQGENDRTGTYCALLTFHAGVDESAFMGFDT